MRHLKKIIAQKNSLSTFFYFLFFLLVFVCFGGIMNEVRTSNKHRQEHRETTSKKQGHNGTKGEQMGTIWNWKERIEQGKPTKLDLLISASYSQVLILRHNFRTNPLKTGIGSGLMVAGAVWIVWNCIEKPKFVFLYLLLFIVLFFIGKKGKKNAN